MGQEIQGARESASRQRGIAAVRHAAIRVGVRVSWRWTRVAAMVSMALIVLMALTTSFPATSLAQGRQTPGDAARPQAIRTVCDPEEQALFVCETDRKGKYIAICAVEEEVGTRWSGVQYRFGPEDRAELVYPRDARQGGSALFFSHVTRGTVYTVSIRFSSGGYTYRVESSGDSASDPIGDGEAGVTVTDAGGKSLAHISCVERPTMFASYLQRALACDLENPHGRAACGDRPFTVDRRAPRGKTPPR